MLFRREHDAEDLEVCAWCETEPALYEYRGEDETTMILLDTGFCSPECYERWLASRWEATGSDAWD
jgi:hypothetical protein